MTPSIETPAMPAPAAAESAPALVGVSAEGRLDGVLFELTTRQTYRNSGRTPLEVVYTFPLPTQAVLLGFASELAGSRREARIVARAEAETVYEGAMVAGDAPVMLESLGNGLHTANIGNLDPGDELTVEFRYAQLMPFEQGRIRVCIPTTVAPRYGSPHDSGLQAQQVPDPRADAEYPFSLRLTIADAAFGAEPFVQTPTHRFTESRASEGRLLVLDQSARLDRDVVVVVEAREPRPSLLLHARDGRAGASPVVALAAFQPAEVASCERIALKLLVDCSGSMNGDSIVSARAALQGALRSLRPADTIALTCFGSTVKHLIAPAPATPRLVRHARVLVDGIAADMSGTEMVQALQAAFALRGAGPADEGADLLLLTDGEIWNADDTVKAARASGHRVFVIGVGTCPAEAVLRRLAEATGGACEFASPGEALERAAERMLGRIRQVVRSDARVDWGCEPDWSEPLPIGVFGGDTVFVAAGLPSAPSTAVARLVDAAADGDRSTTVEYARTEAAAPIVADTLARMVAHRRLAHCTPAEALRIALDYQLMGAQTCAVLVHHRAEADRSNSEATVHRVPSMLAAGWGGTSTVDVRAQARLSFSIPVSPAAPLDAAHLFVPSVMSSPSFIPYLSVCGPAYFDDRAVDDTLPAPPRRFLTIDGRIAEALAAGGGIDADTVVLRDEPMLYRTAHLQLLESGLDSATAWLVIAAWLAANRRNEELDDGHHDALKRALAAIDASRVAVANRVLAALLGSDRWRA